jgi:hypothetical protein
VKEIVMPELDPLPSCTVRVHRLDPTLAELRVEFSNLPADVEVRGRLMGPCCPGATTIEVAYHFRPQPGSPSVFKVLIPEPVFWTAEWPSVYAGPVEFRRDGQPVGSIAVSIGIRAQASRNDGVT